MKYKFLTLAVLGLATAGFVSDAHAINLKNVTSTATKAVSSNPFKTLGSTSNIGTDNPLTNIATQTIASSGSGTSNITNYSSGLTAALAASSTTAGSSSTSSSGSSSESGSELSLEKYQKTVTVKDAPDDILAGPSGGSSGGGLLGGIKLPTIKVGGVTIGGNITQNGIGVTASGYGQTASGGYGASGLTGSSSNPFSSYAGTQTASNVTGNTSANMAAAIRAQNGNTSSNIVSALAQEQQLRNAGLLSK